MNEITISNSAKINLYLDVVGKRPDGYHELQMVMQKISLYDEIYVSKVKSGIEVTCDKEHIPTGEKNIAYKAAKMFKDKLDIKDGVKIHINKKIPDGAGLGGGSSDASAVLMAMNELFEMYLQKEELIDIGKAVGADVPFGLFYGTALAEGIGEKLTRIKMNARPYVVLVKPEFSVSTANVYSRYKVHKRPEQFSVEGIIKALDTGDINDIGKNLYNSLETVTCIDFPEINDIKQKLIEQGAKGSLMSGSGSAVFGIFDDHQFAEISCSVFKEKNKQVFLVELV